MQVATGKVLQFDPARGYGFVAADDGGDDIFLHASVFDGDPSELVPGIDLEFQVMAGDRGRKAFAVRFAEDKSFPQEQTAVPSQPFPETTAVPSQPFPETTALPSQPFPATEEDQMCDVLSQSEFGVELTELLLNTVPALSGAQILEVRQSMLEFARKRGWVDA
jgi:cold shock CspA family protein